MSLHVPYHNTESDPDEEYGRSVLPSPRLHTDPDGSPTDSETSSAQQTPTILGNTEEFRYLNTIITQWSAYDSADFVASLGLPQYCNAFIEDDVVGEAFISLNHDELREMGIASIGHRLSILKAVYEIKVRQDIPFDTDHYIPLSADKSMNETATQKDISRLIQSIKLRDERIVSVEADLRRVAEDYRRLREELLPVFKMAKDRLQPLPPADTHGYDDQPLLSPQFNMTDRNLSGMSRSYSKRAYTGGSTPKTSSPTHIPPTFHDGTALDPSAATIAASSHLTASMKGASQSSSGIPSPTSPSSGHHAQQALVNRSNTQQNSSTRNAHDHTDDLQHNRHSRTERPVLTPTQSSRPDPPPSASRVETRPGPEPGQPSVEIFKSFRVSMDDPCNKVLPAALRKYNINGDWRHFALYIVYGDQERCLAMDERPLILFKQLEKENRKPMFMLRKHTFPVDNSGYPSTGSAPNSASLPDSSRTGQGQINLPGGVL